VVTKILEMALPVFIMLGLGYLCKARQIFDENGLQGLKSFISNITLPVVLFNAFLNAEYNVKTVALFVLIYIGYLIAVAVGFLLKKWIKGSSPFLPFLLASAEGGMLGYALYGLIVGAQTGFAAVDLGQTVFAYTAFLALLKMTDGKKATVQSLLGNMFSNKCFLGMLLGIICGATGLGKIVLNSAAGGIVTSVISMITAPTSALVLIVVGYELNMKKSLLKKVAQTVVFRLVIMIVLLIGVSWIVTALFGYDKELQVALMVLYALPAPFIIPMFADLGEDSEYVSTTLSLNTVITMILFVFISYFYLM
jgi:predicted permease